MNESKRKVITEPEILAVPCPTCNVLPNVGCLNPERHVLATRGCPSFELSFHPKRIEEAYEKQFRTAFGKLGATDKALICYYSFIMLADSVSNVAKEVLGKDFTSREIQTFFAQQAMTELKRDGLI